MGKREENKQNSFGFDLPLWYLLSILHIVRSTKMIYRKQPTGSIWIRYLHNYEGLRCNHTYNRKCDLVKALDYVDSNLRNQITPPGI